MRASEHEKQTLRRIHSAAEDERAAVLSAENKHAALFHPSAGRFLLIHAARPLFPSVSFASICSAEIQISPSHGFAYGFVDFPFAIVTIF